MNTQLTQQEAKIQDIERNMDTIEQIPCQVVHTFAPGLYIREVHMLAESYIIGHYHKTEHLNIMIAGALSLQNDQLGWDNFVAPLMYIAKPGRKIAYVYEDTVWLNVHATTETDIEKLEEMFLDKSGAWHEGADKTRLITHNADDYEQFLTEFNLDESTVRAISENENDQCDLPNGSYKIQKGKSDIEGTGIFATAVILPGEIIVPARINGKRTIAGRYTNHAQKPNAQMVMLANGDIDLVAILLIKGCTGGLLGDEITIDYREALRL